MHILVFDVACEASRLVFEGGEERFWEESRRLDLRVFDVLPEEEELGHEPVEFGDGGGMEPYRCFALAEKPYAWMLCEIIRGGRIVLFSFPREDDWVQAAATQRRIRGAREESEDLSSFAPLFLGMMKSSDARILLASMPVSF